MRQPEREERTELTLIIHIIQKNRIIAKKTVLFYSYMHKNVILY